VYRKQYNVEDIIFEGKGMDKFEILSNSDILKSECNAIAIFTQSYKAFFSACVIITVLGILVTEPFS
jgi:hypothetical protein